MSAGFPFDLHALPRHYARADRGASGFHQGSRRLRATLHLAAPRDVVRQAPRAHPRSPPSSTAVKGPRRASPRPVGLGTSSRTSSRARARLACRPRPVGTPAGAPRGPRRAFAAGAPRTTGGDAEADRHRRHRGRLSPPRQGPHGYPRRALRALCASGDFDVYWAFHLRVRSRLRNLPRRGGRNPTCGRFMRFRRVVQEEPHPTQTPRVGMFGSGVRPKRAAGTRNTNNALALVNAAFTSNIAGRSRPNTLAR